LNPYFSYIKCNTVGINISIAALLNKEIIIENIYFEGLDTNINLNPLLLLGNSQTNQNSSKKSSFVIPFIKIENFFVKNANISNKEAHCLINQFYFSNLIYKDNKIIFDNSKASLKTSFKIDEKNKGFIQLFSKLNTKDDKLMIKTLDVKTKDFDLEISKLFLADRVLDFSGKISLSLQLNEENQEIKADVSTKKLLYNGQKLTQISKFLEQNENLSLSAIIKDFNTEKPQANILISAFQFADNISLLNLIYVPSVSSNLIWDKNKNEILVSDLLINEPQIKLQRLSSETKQQISQAQFAMTHRQEGLPVTIYLKNIDINDATVSFIDKTLPNPPVIDVVNLKIKISELIYPSVNPCNVNISAKFKGTEGSIIGEGSFIPIFDDLNFRLKISVANLPINLFEEYYKNKIGFALVKGYVSLESDGVCNHNNLDFSQNVIIRDIKLPSEKGQEELFLGVKTEDVLSALNSKENEIKFSFKILGDIKDPKFNFNLHLEDVLSSALKKGVQTGVDVFKGGSDAIMHPETIADNVKDVGKTFEKSIQNLLFNIKKESAKE